MLDDSSRIITNEMADDDLPTGKVIHRSLKTKEDIQNYVKHLI
jgi:hypothetical protein